MTEDDPYEDYSEGVVCPNCMGDGSVNCYCGGDLCVCLNYGERDCPTCHAEGEVSSERANRYFQSQREAAEAYRRVFKESDQ